jgi:non-specific serine/threonine protein kinase/serine/threonine-protein kinase
VTPERWRAVKDVIERVSDAPPESRDSVLRDACNGDAELQTDVEKLLAFDTGASALDHIVGAPVERAGPYRIERLLGMGGMGAVYLAVRDDDQYRKRVAVKVISGQLGSVASQRFRTERQILAQLDHPNIARLLDGGALPDGTPYLAMDYIEGQPIDSYCAEHRPEPAAIFRLLLKVCAAVQFAHQNFVVHRDLKAANILVTEDGEPHLLDFGIAKLLDPASADMESTLPANRVMTPASASPEQASGARVTAASDVYSLGILLYRLLTGVSPYAGARDFTSDPARAIREFIPPPMNQTPGLPQRVQRLLARDPERIVRKAIEKDPERRYRTVDEFAADIRRFLENRPVTARPPSLLYRTRKFVARNRALMAAVMLLGLAVAGGIAGTVRYARVADRRYQSLRKLTNSLLFDVDGMLRQLPGTLKTRRDVMANVIEYLAQIEGDAGDNPEVNRSLATAYLRASETVHADGADFTGSRQLAEKAERILRRLAVANPADGTILPDLLIAQWTIAGSWSAVGDFERAERILLDRNVWNRRLLAEGPAKDRDGIFARQLAGSLTFMGDMSIQRNRSDRAVEYMREAFAVREKQGIDHPETNLQGMTMAHLWLGRAYLAQKAYPEAAQHANDTLAMCDRWAGGSPSTSTMAYTAAANQLLCAALAHSGQYAEALAACGKARVQSEARLDAASNRGGGLTDIAQAYSTTALALDLAGRPHDAFPAGRHAKELFAEASKIPGVQGVDTPGGVLFSYEQAANLSQLGAIEKKLGMNAESTADLIAARDGLANLVKHSPQFAQADELRRATAVLVTMQ